MSASARVSYSPRTAFTVHALDFGIGVDADASDNVIAFQAAFDHAAEIRDSVSAFTPLGGVTVVVAPGGDYLIDSGLTLSHSINLDMTGAALGYTGAVDETVEVLAIGEADVFNTDCVFRGLSIVNRGATTAGNLETIWDTDGLLALRMINPTNCMIEVMSIQSFNQGLQFWAEGAGCTHNTVNLRKLRDNKYHLELNNRVGSFGFCNQNTFIGGNFQDSSTTDDAGNGYGIRMTKETSANESMNNNLFIQPSFELGKGSAGTSDRIPWLIDNGALQNRVMFARNEGNSDTLIQTTANATNARNNIFEHTENTASVGQVDNQSSWGSNVVVYPFSDNAQGQVWDSGDLREKAVPYTTGEIMIPGVNLWESSSAVPVSGTDNIEVRKDWLGITAFSRGIGAFVDTEFMKQFQVFCSVVGNSDTNGGRVNIVAFDEDGDILTDSGSDHPYVQGMQNSFNASNYGGSYQDPSDFTDTRVYQVKDAVKKVAVIWRGGSSEVYATRMQIRPYGYFRGPFKVFLDTGRAPDTAVAITDPDTSLAASECGLGRTIWNASNPTSAGAFWVASTAGALAPAHADTTAYVLGELVNNASNVYACATAGTSGTSTPPTGTGTGITDGTVTWDYYKPLGAYSTGANAT